MDGQAAGKIVRITEEVVAPAGASAVLNCTLSSPPSNRALVFVSTYCILSRNYSYTGTET